MTPHRRTTPARTHAPTQLPTTIWLPGRQEPADTPAGRVLPHWAITKIRTEFTRTLQGPPAPLLRLQVNDTAAGMDARTRCTPHGGDANPGDLCPTSVVLAELHPDTLPITPPTSDYGPCERGAIDDGWPGFFHRAHRLLRAEGLLLLATRQRRENGRLTDPLGLLIATARTAGFRYLQHIVIVHGHPAEDRIVPNPPADSPPGLIHSDLLVLHTARSSL